MLLDGVICIATGYMAYSISLEVHSSGLVMAWNDFMGSVLFLMFLNNYMMGRFGFYSEKRFPSYWALIKALVMAVSVDFIVLTTGAFLIGIRPFPRVFVTAYFLMALFSFIITRLSLYFYLDRRALTTFNSRQILLVGVKDRVSAVAQALDQQRSWGHQVAGFLNVDGKGNPRTGSIPILGSLDEFDNVLRERQIDEVIFALPKGSPIDLRKFFGKCERIGVGVRIVPALFDPAHPSLRVETIQGIPTLTDYRSSASASGLLYKRILDLVAGLLGFAFFLILYPVVGLAIKLDSPGPVLFKQRRVALHGRQFNLYKFRTMVAGAESTKREFLAKTETAWPVYKTEHDPRITKVGRFLRNTSLDEFPQFINVLKGEMSLVGTRPPIPDEVKQYADWHRRRISSKPGITGLWQISGRKEITDFIEVVKLDLQYIDGWRFRNDLAILWKTIWVVLARKGAK